MTAVQATYTINVNSTTQNRRAEVKIPDRNDF